MSEKHDWPCGFRPVPWAMRQPGFASAPCARCGWRNQEHLDRPEGEPHHPNRYYLCDDPDCCDNGCPVLTCAVCREDWPCATKREHVAQRRAAAASASS